MQDFVHLHVHTEYSLLDGLSNINKLAAKAKAHGQKAIAMTDHGVMYGAVHFYNACKNAGIKPIIGVEAYMSETSRFDKQARMGRDQFHLTLLAKDNEGYRNLLKLVTLSNAEGFSYKPRIDFDLLEKYGKGLIATTGCPGSIINKKLREGNSELALEWLHKFHKLFKDDYYVEIQDHPKLPKEFQELTNQHVIWAKEYGIPLVATNDVHYVEADDAEAQDAIIAIGTRKVIADTNRLSMLNSPDYYLKSTQEMYQSLGNYPEALQNTVAIADKCNVEIPTGKMIFPNYPTDPGKTLAETLRDMTYKTAKDRFGENLSKEVTDRIDYELEIITDKGYDSYFLIVQDFVNWAKDQGIGVGPGRGSAAGSLVSYCLGITDIDPLEHVLAFERFLNPQRPSPPDVDIDIADVRRDEVIKYVSEKYGEDHVAQVITFGKMEAKAAIRDIGRVLGMPYAEPDAVSKAIPDGMKLPQALEESSEVKAFYAQPKYKKLIDLALRVEGTARHSSVHAAAVIIADKPLDNYTALQIDSKNGKQVTQFDMYALDLNVDESAIGLLKMDFLGLRNLSILGEALKFLKEQQDLDVDLNKISIKDEKVFDLLSQGHTTGVFQMESPGMRRVARNLKPSRFSDITALVALYRPGPMDLIDDFIAGKEDPKKIKYPHKVLEPVLAETYGIPVYQEQVLQIANVFAGYTLGEADILRRAIGKKKKYILDKEKKRFVKGAEEKGFSADKAKEIWVFIEKFAGYGFNKAHSAAYAMIAYRTAYMKVNYPIEYMAALLSVEASSHGANRDEKIAQGVEECRRMGIQVLPPRINESNVGFVIEDVDKKESLNGKAIRFGFAAIKNVGVAAIENIIEARGDEKFTSITDFCGRIDNRKVNKKVVESLVKAGAFDRFGTRPSILAGFEEIKAKAVKKQEKQAKGQFSLFDGIEAEEEVSDNLPNLPDFTDKEKLEDEKALLGVYLTDHPLAAAMKEIEGLEYTKTTDIDLGIHKGKQVTLVGILSTIRQILTKKNNSEMAFATLEDITGKVDMVIFPKLYAEVKLDLQPNIPMLVKGKVEERDGDISYIVDSIRPLSGGVHHINDETNPNTLTIPRGLSKEVLTKVGTLLKSNKGEDIVTIAIPSKAGQAKTFVLPYRVDFNSELQKLLRELLK